MKNKDIMSTYDELIKLRAAGTTRFSARVSFAIARNIRLLQPIAEDIQISREEILGKYGDPQGDDRYLIRDIPAFNKEMKELDSVEVGIELSRIKFSDIEHLELTIQEMDALYPMIQEGEG